MPQDVGSAVSPDRNHFKSDAYQTLSPPRKDPRQFSAQSPELAQWRWSSPGSDITISDLSSFLRNSWIRIISVIRRETCRDVGRSLTDSDSERQSLIDLARSRRRRGTTWSSYRSRSGPGSGTDICSHVSRNSRRRRVTKRPVATPAWQEKHGGY